MVSTLLRNRRISTAANRNQNASKSSPFRAGNTSRSWLRKRMTLVIWGSDTARLSINDVDAGGQRPFKTWHRVGRESREKREKAPLHRFKTEASLPRIFHLIHAFSLRFAHSSLIALRCAAERCLREWSAKPSFAGSNPTRASKSRSGQSGDSALQY